MNEELNIPDRDCYSCDNVGCPGCSDIRRRRYGDVLRRWGLLDEVSDPKAAEEFVVTDLLAVANDERRREVAALRASEELLQQQIEGQAKEIDRLRASDDTSDGEV